MAGIRRSSEPKNDERREGSSKKRGASETLFSFFVLRSRRSKNPLSSIFGAVNRRTPHLLSSIFGAEDRRTPHLRYSAPNNGSKIGRKKRGVGFLPPKNEEPPIVLLLGTKNEEPPSSIFSTGRMDEEPTPGYSFYDPPGHQLFSAILTFGSSDRSSSLKIGPRIGIGPLLASATVRMVKDPDPLWQRARCPSVRVMRRDVRSSSCVRMHASRQHASERRIHTRPLAEEAASRMRRSEVRGEGRRCHREASARGGPDVGDAIAPTPRRSQ